jgi:hypothetical protein
MGAAANSLGWLEQWYQAQCDGEWEHGRGITIETVDNPGWVVRIHLIGTAHESLATDQRLSLLGEPPGPENGNIGSDDWMTCVIQSGQFVGAGDPTKLESILVCFKRFIEQG